MRAGGDPTRARAASLSAGTRSLPGSRVLATGAAGALGAALLARLQQAPAGSERGQEASQNASGGGRRPGSRPGSPSSSRAASAGVAGTVIDPDRERILKP